ncbi:RNAse P Rpr2/Rpp21/SNM1 subunit domain-containing protein [Dipodascopsis tothii]|uniref:RNAse P Rpr2/Rpp21/SNM1 subunit domain-containing protein n=1 Tax=Dipodascopsis tothii TaxID=44089 RepID=UPI0034CFF52E
MDTTESKPASGCDTSEAGAAVFANDTTTRERPSGPPVRETGGPRNRLRAPTSVKNRDQYLRASFLYQASLLMGGDRRPESLVLGRVYASHMRSVARKNVIRLDPSVKRTVCKRCETPQVPGASCVVRLESAAAEDDCDSRRLAGDVLTYTCGVCGGQRRYPVGRDSAHTLFGDRAENIVA